MDPLGEWTVDAKEALQISFYNRGEKTPQPITSHRFNPQFVYPFFGENETIYGYKDLEIDLRFAATDCKPCLQIKFSEEVKKVGDAEAEDVLGPLKQHLPQNVLDNVQEFDDHVQLHNMDFVPPGNLIESYSLEGGDVFELWKVPLSDPAAKKVFKNLQILTLFYIEGGTEIDLEDEEEWSTNRWNVYFLYQKLIDGQYSIIGYCTVYLYWFFSGSKDLSGDKSGKEWTEKGDQKDIIQQLRARISQFIILPPYQKQGHGGKFYDKIIGDFLSTKSVLEITVEDPNESFMDLRDLRDYRRLRGNGTFKNLSFRTYSDRSWDLEDNRKRNKLAPRQFKRMVELELLRQLDNKKDGKLYKQYRMIVKGRVYKMHRDILAQLDRLERIDKLDETYHHVEDDYYRLLNKMRVGERLEEEKEKNEQEEEEEDNERPKKRVKV